MLKALTISVYHCPQKARDYSIVCDLTSGSALELKGRNARWPRRRNTHASQLLRDRQTDRHQTDALRFPLWT